MLKKKTMKILCGKTSMGTLWAPFAVTETISKSTNRPGIAGVSAGSDGGNKHGPVVECVLLALEHEGHRPRHIVGRDRKPLNNEQMLENPQKFFLKLSWAE